MILKLFSDGYFKHLRKLRKSQIIFFNGCFDILHPGHYEFLKEVKKSRTLFGGKIVCGLNSDKSFKLQKKSHPLINDENSRASTLEALGVDTVIIFDEETPLQLIMSLMPDKYITTRDYFTKFPKPIDLEFCIKHDIQVNYIEKVEGYSTTNIYNKIAEHVKQEIREKL